MSIETKTFYTLKCDRCGALPEDAEFTYWDDADVLYECFPEWEEIGEKDCCPDCWQWSEDETEIEFKPIEE